MNVCKVPDMCKDMEYPMIWRDSTNLQSKEVPYEACCK